MSPGLVLNELNARIRARDQAIIELEQLQRSIERYIDTPGLTDIESRLLSTKAAFPNESNIQQLCSTLEQSISRVREERNRSIAQLSELAQTVEPTQTSELKSLQEKAKKLAVAVSSDPRVGALLQQIDSSVSRRFERRAELLRDMTGLMMSLAKIQSLDEMNRIVDRANAIAALDATDDELAERSRQLQAEAENVRASLESLLGEMARACAQGGKRAEHSPGGGCCFRGQGTCRPAAGFSESAGSSHPRLCRGAGTADRA